MTYTFLSAQYANPEHTAAVAITAEAAAVAFSATDTPEHWAALHAVLTPADYVPPPQPPAPTREQLLAELAALQAKIEALPE
ncbi:MAG: hypothetical protein ACK5XN_26735 [Bacteroidota bacterium]